MIVSSGDVFSVDESWLSKESCQTPSQIQSSQLAKGDRRSEREIIEAALAESKGRVSGPVGAAAKLGMPPSTLEFRIKALQMFRCPRILPLELAVPRSGPDAHFTEAGRASLQVAVR